MINDGWKTVLLVRMTPLPFSVSSYLLGVTSVTIKDFILGSLGEILHIILWLYIGKTLEKFNDVKNRTN